MLRIHSGWIPLEPDLQAYSCCYRVVVFCSYGSTRSPGKSSPEGTPAVLSKAACMSLWPRELAHGVQANGLLLNLDEFKEVVSQFNKELNIHSDLLQKIFDLTVEHVGAVCTILEFIMAKVCSLYHTFCCISPLTLPQDENFHAKESAHGRYLFQRILS